MKLLGISCYYHDSAATLVDAGRIVAAAQEERFTRKKHDEGFPTNAVRYCLAEGGVGPGELDGSSSTTSRCSSSTASWRPTSRPSPRGSARR
jgi:predicted NodU family carbamoyl transferase